MKNWRSHFVFSRSEQNGIFVLVLIIIVLQLVYFFFPFSSEVETDTEEEKIVRQLQSSVDSLKQIALESKDSLAPFNPNFISDYKGYMLGMSVEEIDRLHKYRARNLWVNSAEDFQKVTGVSDSLFMTISPAFRFPDFRSNISGGSKDSKKAFSAPLPKTDLNSATAEELKSINGIGDKLSARIVNYRSSLGGFRGNEQLKDVYGLTPEVIQRILQKFEVKFSVGEKLDVNEVTLMQLVELPYFDYEQARALVRYRQDVKEIQNFEELRQIKNFPIEKLDRIKLYLTINGEN